MQGDILLQGLVGSIKSVNGGTGLIQQHGNFPRFDEAADEPGNNFEQSVTLGYTLNGQFVYQFETGEFAVDDLVLFDIAEGPIIPPSTAPQNFAVNVRH